MYSQRTVISNSLFLTHCPLYVGFWTLGLASADEHRSELAITRHVFIWYEVADQINEQRGA
jgi:hypothetical protein